MGLIRKRVAKAGGTLVFADGFNFENSAIGNLMFTQMAGFAEYEKEVIRERCVSGRKSRAQEGQQPCRGKQPFGYHVVCKSDVLRGLYPAHTLGTYQVRENQADIVRELYVRYAGGASLRELGRWLSTQGILPAYGGREWHAPVLRKLLQNPLYKGEPAFGKSQRLTDETRINRGLGVIFYKERPQEEWINLAAPALVDTDLWETCQTRLATNRALLGGNPKRKYMLSGLCRCPVCSGRMVGNGIGTVGGKKYVYYHCRTSHSGQVGTRVVAKEADAAVLSGVTQVARRPELVETALRAYEAHCRGSASLMRLAKLETELAGLDAEEKATAQAQIQGIKAGARADVYAGLFAALAEKRKALQEQTAELQAQNAFLRLPDAKETTEKVSFVLSALQTALTSEHITDAERHDLLARVVLHVIPQPEPGAYKISLKPVSSYQITVLCVTMIGWL